jgi:hypothetical protein
MIPKPGGQFRAYEFPARQLEHQPFLFVYARGDFEAVQDQERLHRRMGHALVSVHKGVVVRDREAQRGGLLSHRPVQVMTLEGRFSLRQRGLQSAKVANARCSAGRLENPPVKRHHLRPGSGTASSEAPVELLILAEHVVGAAW